MTDQTRWGIDMVQQENKAKAYEDQKEMRDNLAFNFTSTPYGFHAFFIRFNSNKNVDHCPCDIPSTLRVTVFIF